MEKQQYRLDRTSFKAMDAVEADADMQDYKNYSWQERLKVAAYLNSVAYNFPLGNPPKMDKQIFIAVSLYNE